jgi:hypothetical protein
MKLFLSIIFLCNYIDNIDIRNIFEFDLDSLSNNNNNNLSTSDVPVLPVDNLLPSLSSSSHIEKSSLFSSLYPSGLITTSSTNIDLPYQNNRDNMSLEQELLGLEQDILKACCYSSTSTNTNIMNNMSNENVLVTQAPDPGMFVCKLLLTYLLGYTFVMFISYISLDK